MCRLRLIVLGPRRKVKQLRRALGQQDVDAIARNAEGSRKFERIGHRHQAGAAGRGVSETATATQRLRRARCRLGDRRGGGGNRRGGFNLGFGKNTQNGLRRLDIQPCGMPMYLFGTRFDHHFFSL